jgi:tripartite-type tricarboxylate transporter receptor subunit TctC
MQPIFGVTGPQRMTIPALAPLPTLAESGLPGFGFAVWHGLYAVRGTPPEVIEKINAALRIALKDSELIKRQEALGLRQAALDDQAQAPAGNSARAGRPGVTLATKPDARAC